MGSTIGLCHAIIVAHLVSAVSLVVAFSCIDTANSNFSLTLMTQSDVGTGEISSGWVVDLMIVADNM